MAEHVECYKDILAVKGIKNTRQRLAVIREIGESEVPRTAEEIFLKVHDDCGNLSLSTVYRILDMFCKKGIVTRTGLMEGGRAMYELTPDAHRHNLICLSCHKILPLDNCPLSQYESDVEKSTGYTISGHKLEVYGICPDCKCVLDEVGGGNPPEGNKVDSST